MSKYDALWQWIASQQAGCDRFTLTFEQIESIAGVPLDHSFLNAKKELLGFGFEVQKISMKTKTVFFIRAESTAPQ